MEIKDLEEDDTLTIGAEESGCPASETLTLDCCPDNSPDAPEVPDDLEVCHSPDAATGTFGCSNPVVVPDNPVGREDSRTPSVNVVDDVGGNSSSYLGGDIVDSSSAVGFENMMLCGGALLEVQERSGGDSETDLATLLPPNSNSLADGPLPVVVRFLKI